MGMKLYIIKLKMIIKLYTIPVQYILYYLSLLFWYSLVLVVHLFIFTGIRIEDILKEQFIKHINGKYYTN